jgi:hypothetical protein
METRMTATPESAAKAASDLRSQREAERLEAQRDEVERILLERTAHTFEKGAAYSNLIILGGYAGVFSIWSSTKEQLTPSANIAVALSLGVSLAAFILFEVYKMVQSGRAFMRAQGLLQLAAANPREFLRTLGEVEVTSKRWLVWLIRIWVPVMIISVGSALIAISLLFYNFLALLMGLPLWPH